MYLLDAGIVLELRKARSGRTDAGLTAWAGSVAPQDMFLSAVSLLELESGAARLERTDKAAGAALRAWLDTQVARAFDGRILAVDAAIVRRCGQLAYEDSRNGLLAATALEHGPRPGHPQPRDLQGRPREALQSVGLHARLRARKTPTGARRRAPGRCG
jgi:predicted nucleic acid-binding protein